MGLTTRIKSPWQTIGRPRIVQYIRPLAGIFLLLFVAVISGGIAALFPAATTVKLGFLVGGVLVFVLALFVPTGAKVPTARLRRLLYLLLVVWVAWPVYLSYHGLPGPGINPTRLLYWCLAGFWFFWFVVSPDLRLQLSARIALFRPCAYLILVYLGWALLCALTSKAPFFSAYYLFKLMIGPLFVFLVAMSCLRDRKDVDFALLMMVIAALISCAFGILEAGVQKNLFYDIVPSLFPQGEDGASFWAEKLASDKSRGGAYRVMSTFTHPLTFGEYLVLSFPLAVYLTGYAMPPWQRFLGLITVPVIIAGLYLTHTRSAQLATGVVVFCLVAFLGVRAMRQQRSFFASLVGAFSLFALMCSGFAVLGVVTELTVGRNAAEAGSSLDRLVMLRHGSSLVMNSPIFGYGSGLAAETLGFLPGFLNLTIDNFYLSIALESGFPGLFLFIGIFAYIIFEGFRASLKMTPQDGARVFVIIASLIGFLVVKSVLSLTDNFDPVFLLIALLAISIEKPLRPTLAGRRPA